jgi:hypothetical protein
MTGLTNLQEATMQLKMRRSQRASGILSKSVMFMLDARLDLNAEEVANVKKYKLGEQVIYNSAASRKHLEGAAEAAIRESAGSFVSQLARTAMHRLSLNITIDGLTKGQHVECKDLDELIAAENAIKQAAHATRTYLEIAQTFDGREVIYDLDAEQALAA